MASYSNFLTLIQTMSLNHSVPPMAHGAMPTLYDTLFMPYRKQLRPRVNDSDVLNVTVQIWFKQVLKVNEADQIITLHLWLELYWNDEYIKWNPADFDGIDTLTVPAKDLWIPDLLVYNNANMNIEENEYETNAIISHNGDVMLFRSVITDITCKLDMTYFPFDEQACSMMLASWSNDGSRLFINPKGNGSDSLTFYIMNSEWNVVAFSVRRNIKIYNCCPHPYPDLTFYFILTRNPGYYMNSLIIPSAFIALVTIIGFFTPHSSTGENTEKVSLGVTSLLSMAIIMMMVSDEMPATTNVLPLIGKYYIGLIFILFLAAFTTTITLATQMRGLSCDAPSYWTKAVFFNFFARIWIIKILLPEVPERVTRNEQRLRSKKRRPSVNNFDFVSMNACANNRHNGSPNVDGFPAAPRPHPTQRPSFRQKIFNRLLLSETMPHEVSVDHEQQQRQPTTPMGGRQFSVHSNGSAASTPQSPVHNNNHQSFKLLPITTRLPAPDGASATPSDHAENRTSCFDMAASTDQYTNESIRIIQRLGRDLTQIRRTLEEHEKRAIIARQWRQVARILERVLMFAFIGLIALFALYILMQQGEQLVMNTELMDKLSEA